MIDEYYFSFCLGRIDSFGMGGNFGGWNFERVVQDSILSFFLIYNTFLLFFSIFLHVSSSLPLPRFFILVTFPSFRFGSVRLLTLITFPAHHKINQSSNPAITTQRSIVRQAAYLSDDSLSCSCFQSSFLCLLQSKSVPISPYLPPFSQWAIIPLRSNCDLPSYLK